MVPLSKLAISDRLDSATSLTSSTLLRSGFAEITNSNELERESICKRSFRVLGLSPPNLHRRRAQRVELRSFEGVEKHDIDSTTLGSFIRTSAGIDRSLSIRAGLVLLDKVFDKIVAQLFPQCRRH
jgi:hypothetical protein